jgi:hypothetical protein
VTSSFATSEALSIPSLTFFSAFLLESDMLDDKLFVSKSKKEKEEEGRQIQDLDFI